MISPIRALIFDFDGLLIDTESPEYRSWQEVFQAHGCVLPHEEWVACIGTSATFDPYALLAQQLGHPIDKETVRRTRRARFAELMADQTLLPGVQETLEEARRRGLKLGVASSSPRRWVMDFLDRLEIAGWFDCVKSADDVAQVKPDPALYQEALRALAVAPAEAIAFEDSPNGVRAAKEAGLFCVVIPNAVTRTLVFDGADLHLDSLADMPLGKLLGAVQT